MTTVLVTGGAGFIGSNFCRYIYNNYPGWNIIILDALTYAGNIENIKDIILDGERVQFWQGDVNDVELVHDLTSISDYVVHFAAETHVARSLYANRVFFQTAHHITILAAAGHRRSAMAARMCHQSQRPHEWARSDTRKTAHATSWPTTTGFACAATRPAAEQGVRAR